MSIIQVNNLSFAYTRVPVLENISFSVCAGDYVGLIGPNGGGKTTLLKTVLGLEKAQGDIFLFDTPLKDFTRKGGISLRALEIQTIGRASFLWKERECGCLT